MLEDIDENLEQLMKEKAEYHKQGMKSTRGGYKGAGAFDVQSHVSGRTGASRVTDASNAYLYSAGDQGRMQTINDALQEHNPSLVGSQMISNDNFDVEASVISRGKKLPGGKVLGPGRGMDDSRSIMSLDSNISGVSRKSAVSLIDMSSLASLASSSKKRPGDRGLRANAERRTQQAQMALIDVQLKKLQDTEDLSYASRAAEPSEDADGAQRPMTGRTDENGRQLVDETTLARLLDECKEEQEHRFMIEVAHSEYHGSNRDTDSLHGDSQASHRQLAALGGLPIRSERSMMELAKVDRSRENL